jgi:hypothetical protein
MEPVDDNDEQCDLCSESTGMHDGIGWKIVLCPLHSSAQDLLEACKMTEKANEECAALSKAYPDGTVIPKIHLDPVLCLCEKAEKLRQAAIAKATR